MDLYDQSDHSGLDESLWERFDEAKKALRTVRCCNKLNWGAPDANEVTSILSFSLLVQYWVTSGGRGSLHRQPSSSPEYSLSEKSWDHPPPQLCSPWPRGGHLGGSQLWWPEEGQHKLSRTAVGWWIWPGLVTTIEKFCCWKLTLV